MPLGAGRRDASLPPGTGRYFIRDGDQSDHRRGVTGSAPSPCPPTCLFRHMHRPTHSPIQTASSSLRPPSYQKSFTIGRGTPHGAPPSDATHPRGAPSYYCPSSLSDGLTDIHTISRAFSVPRTSGLLDCETVPSGVGGGGGFKSSCSEFEVHGALLGRRVSLEFIRSRGGEQAPGTALIQRRGSRHVPAQKASWARRAHSSRTIRLKTRCGDCYFI